MEGDGIIFLDQLPISCVANFIWNKQINHKSVLCDWFMDTLMNLNGIYFGKTISLWITKYWTRFLWRLLLKCCVLQLWNLHAFNKFELNELCCKLIFVRKRTDEFENLQVWSGHLQLSSWIRFICWVKLYTTCNIITYWWFHNYISYNQYNIH